MSREIGYLQIRAQSVPKRPGTVPLNRVSRPTEIAELSHLAPHPDNPHQPPSNVWGVGYRLLDDHEEARLSA